MLSESTTLAADNNDRAFEEENKVALLRMLQKVEFNVSNLDEAVIIVDGIAVFKKHKHLD